MTRTLATPELPDPGAGHAQMLDELFELTKRVADPAEVMRLTARLLGQHLHASRCAYAHVDADQDHFDLFGDYNDGVPSIVGRYAFSDFGMQVRDLMRADLPYINHDVDSDPRTAGTDLSAYRATRIQAVICVPLHRDGRFVAGMAVHQDRPRVWRDEEIALMLTVVARCWESLERLRTERALRDANQRLSLALAAGELGDWSWDAGTDRMTLSAAAARLYGLEPGSSWTRSAMRRLLHRDDREPARLAAAHAAAQRGLYDIEYRVPRPEGLRWVSVQGKPTYGADGRLAGMIGVVRDITARRLAEERARNEAQTLELLNQTGAALAGELEIDALLQRVTDAATQLTGARFGAFFYNGTDDQGEAYLLYALSGAPREAFEKLGHPRPTTLFGPTFRGGAPIRCDDILVDPRYGQWRPHHGMPAGHLPVRSYLAVAVTSRTGQVFGGLFFGHPEPGRFDARAERLAVGIAAQAGIAIDNARLYADVQRASALKDEFLATLSHELRTPLSAILGWVHLLRRRYPDAAGDLAKGIAVIERNARAQSQLVDDLLDMSRIVSGKLQLDLQPVAPLGCIEAAIETVRPAAEAAGVRIETRLDPGAGVVSADAVRLQQVVWNLVANAVKFTPRGGLVSVQLVAEGEALRIVVQDSGIGIAPAFLPHIFDRFRQADGSITRRFGGLGLGLAIVRQLVELHGGSVQASSAGEGQGSCFVVRLPLQAAGQLPALQVFAPLPPASTELAGLCVLVVDDEADARELLQRMLADAGAQVLVADSAQAVLQAIARERPQVLVSDIGMPLVDGYELLRRVRALGPAQGGNLPAIALTAFARAEDRVRALKAGFRAHVAKPVEPAELVATIASAAGR
ncbi:GAF domain-containing hybrid sensor histidine kinase/response regulator [Pseudorhodoferax sp. Leaf265]|uniref:hybrid sensor histidine kinase/response regulator n=1 Tax=Pseudorhodoferax sp. Leaf265 TaxID=1736315 RepID=UPI0009E97A64|nr:GAF domain-containing hybrid sensor histidine kinase/response regulator [Pseudorhodoferax sp. Leaf265]